MKPSKLTRDERLAHQAAGQDRLPRPLVGTVLLVALALAAGCGARGHARSTTQSATPGGVPNIPISGALRVVELRGSVQVQTGRHAATRWRALARGQQAENVRGLRVEGRGAQLRLDDGHHPTRLWLRGGSALRLGQTDSGEIRLSLVRGTARISATGSAQLALVEGRKRIALSGRDLLLQRTATGRLARVQTALRPDAAGWTMALSGRRRSPLGTLQVRLRAKKNKTRDDDTGAEPAASADRPAGSMRLRRVIVSAHTSGDAAATEVEHVFYNPTDQQLEGTFRFPLPERASLLGLAMEIDGELMEGELVERDKARRTYQSIVDAMRDPALLEWEQGNTFKLRVFPIEPRSEKRIVIRYVAPLVRGPAGLEYRYDVAAPADQPPIDRFSVKLDGRDLLDARGLTGERAIAALVDAPTQRTALREVKADGVYTAVRLAPDWRRLLGGRSHRRGAHAQPAPRDLLLVVDTSRSSLESRPLALQTVRELVGQLRPRDRFVVLASDITVRAHAAKLAPARDTSVERALRFVEQIEPDGASDLGAALRELGRRVRRLRSEASERKGRRRTVQVVYVGDGTPTWGACEPKRLRTLAAEALGKQPLHAVILGRSADGELLRRLAAQQGGRAIAPRGELEIQRFSLQLAYGAELPRLRSATVEAGADDEVYPREPRTLFRGDELTVLVRTPTGKKPPKKLRLRGSLGDRDVALSISLSRVAPARHVAHRWARRHIAQLQQSGAAKEKVVAASKRHGVMSRYTAFLVLESEEAYARHQIARRQRARDQRVQVSGADLESLGARQARLSPDHLQPGDPEVRIPAPRDARSVVVVFPWGETKIAHYEQQSGMWMVRFLVSKDTPDGVYRIAVRITHADGRVELSHLSYVVDTRGPKLRLSMRRLRGTPARYLLSAKQIATRLEIERERERQRIAGGTPSRKGDDSGAEAKARYAQLVKDIKRIEVRAPDGQLLRLSLRRSGWLRAVWRPRRALRGEQLLTVVAVDKAYNRSVLQLRFDPDSGRLRQRTVR